MEQLKRIGQVCRHHYEKIVLVLVLLLMGGAVLVIYNESEAQRNRARDIAPTFERQKVNGVKPVDLAPIEASLQSATNPPTLTIGGSHNLFNPVRWIQYPGKPMIKQETGLEVGPFKLQITEVRPLNLTIVFERAVGGGPDQKVGYHTVVTNDLAVPARRRLTQFVTLNETNKQVFVITEAKGPADAPTELVARLKDYGNETATFGPGKPYVRVIGYEVDLKYAVTGAAFPGKRKDMTIQLEGETYKIVDITENKVVLSDNSNGKRYTIEQTTPQ